MPVSLHSEEEQLTHLDRVALSDRLSRLKDATFVAKRRISVDRARLAMESWMETEGEDIEVRRAKLFKKVVENVPIAIHDLDVIVGRETEHLVGTPMFPDEIGEGVPGLWDETDDIGGMLFRGAVTRAEKDVLRECCRFLASGHNRREGQGSEPGFRLLPGHHLPGDVGQAPSCGCARPDRRSRERTRALPADAGD
jgi:hypothetical protein